MTSLFGFKNIKLLYFNYNVLINNEFFKIKSLNKQLITVGSFDYFRTVFTTALNYDFQ